MATLNLGRIKPVFKGAWTSGAFVIDDIVTHGNETFICIQAGTNKATSDASYWTKLAAKGTDGTDVGTTITAQGDILYRDGSGLQKLAKPASDKFLQNTSGGVLSWESLSSDFVKIASQSLDATGLGSFEFQNCFSAANDALYGGYHLQMYHQNTGNNGLDVRWMSGTNTELTGSGKYKSGGVEGYRQTNNSNNADGSCSDGDGNDKMPWDGWGMTSSNNAEEGHYYSVHIQGNMYGGTAQNRSCTLNMSGRDNSSPNYIIGKVQCYRYEGTENITGIKFYLSSGNLTNGQCTLWGLKK